MFAHPQYKEAFFVSNATSDCAIFAWIPLLNVVGQMKNGGLTVKMVIDVRVEFTFTDIGLVNGRWERQSCRVVEGGTGARRPLLNVNV